MEELLKWMWVGWLSEIEAVGGRELKRRTGDRWPGSLDPGQGLSAGGRELLMPDYGTKFAYPAFPNLLSRKHNCAPPVITY